MGSFEIFAFLYPLMLGLGGVVYFFALFLGLTVWQEKIRRPRLFGWAAVLFVISITVLGASTPLSWLWMLSEYSSYSQPMGGAQVIYVITSLLFWPVLLLSFCIFFAALVPDLRRVRVKRPMAGAAGMRGVPVKHPLDD